MKKTPSKVQQSVAQAKLVGYLGLVLIAMAVLLNLNTLSNQYAFDDASVITDNFLVKRGFDGMGDILSTSYRFGYWNQPGTLYRPFSLLMFAAEYELFDGKAWIGHFMNLLMYALTAFALFTVLRKIFSKYSVYLPFLITLLFVVHPIHTEVVANIKSRDEIGAFLFVLISLIFWFQYLDKNKIISLLYALIAFLAAFMFKENVITFLALFPLILYFRDTKDWKSIFLKSAPFLLPMALYLFLRWLILEDLNTISNLSILENVLAGADTTWLYYATSIVLLGKYLLMSLFPWPLSADYSYPEIGLYQPGDMLFILSLVIHAGLLAYLVYGLKHKHPEAFGLAFYFITISIVSNLFITIGASFGERFLYVPVLGILISVLFLLIRVKAVVFPASGEYQSWKDFIKRNTLFISIFLLVVLLSSAVTIERNSDWKDDFTLYGADVLTCPNSTRLHHFYGLELLQDKRRNAPDEASKMMYLDSAIRELNRAVALYDSYSDTYERLAYAHMLKAMPDEAIRFYQKSIELNPTNSLAYNNMGQIFFERKDYPKAEELYRKALSLNPKFADAYFNLGSTLGTKGDFPGSVESFKKAIEFDPENARAYYYLGISLSNMNRIQEAQPYFDKAGQLDASLKRK
ncbi:MAG: tetratricopeptide repeat protein [Bacteroidales bacterium]|nr:tetratricopeptide repeat protein [Bacteroidales bacterium]